MRPEWRIHPELTALDDILAPTYGLLVYQEQALQALNVLCGWGYAEADLVFGAMRKKDRVKMDAAHPKFLEAGLANGISQEGLAAFWSVIDGFADYSFQPRPLGRLRTRLLLDGVSEGTPPQRVHVCTPLECRRGRGQALRVPAGVRSSGDSHPSSGCQHLRGGIHPYR